jgi:hypothetical protein
MSQVVFTAIEKWKCGRLCLKRHYLSIVKGFYLRMYTVYTMYREPNGLLNKLLSCGYDKFSDLQLNKAIETQKSFTKH